MSAVELPWEKRHLAFSLAVFITFSHWLFWIIVYAQHLKITPHVLPQNALAGFMLFWIWSIVPSLMYKKSWYWHIIPTYFLLGSTFGIFSADTLADTFIRRIFLVHVILFSILYPQFVAIQLKKFKI